MTSDNARDEDIVSRVQEHLTSHFGGAAVRVSLTEQGRAVVGRLGTKWVERALASLTLAYPRADLELVLAASQSEPMKRPEPVLPSLAGPMYGDRGIGRISVTYGDESQKPVRRIVSLPSEMLLDGAGEFAFIQPTDRVRRVAGRVYSGLYDRAPLMLDAWRQRRNTKVQDARGEMRPKDRGLASAGEATRLSTEPGPQVAWFALHWLESGGAESWAFESAALAAKAGFEVVITADVAAPQRLLDRALDITEHVYLAANGLAEEDWEPFITNLVRKHRVSVVHIHHSRRAYDALPEFRHTLESLTVIDSTHIVEHRTGGFVRQSIEFSPLVDLHHVISPELQGLYVDHAGIDPAKVVFHPLTEASAPPAVEEAVERARHPGPLRIGFLGRLAPQKRPFLFIELARRLHRRRRGAFTFIMQGDGVLGPVIERQIKRKGLTDVIERRAWGPVDSFMAGIDVLVVSSDNEGLTLTSLEAEMHGVLVLSADVGSQRTVIAPAMLVPRAPRDFLKAATRALLRVAASERAYREAMTQQTRLVQELSNILPASVYFEDMFHKLKEKI